MNPEKYTVAPVTLSESNPEWVEKFDEVKHELTTVVGSLVNSIEHIGSTSIPDLPAKPEIDVLIGVEHLADAEKCISPLQSIDYLYYPRFEEFVPNRRYFRKSEGSTPLVHVHVYESASREYVEHILFRDYLREHPEAVSEYEGIKKRLLIVSQGDRKMYQAGKKDFFEDIIQRALVEKGQR